MPFATRLADGPKAVVHYVNPQTIEREILTLLENACGPGPLSSLVSDLRKLDSVEHTIAERGTGADLGSKPGDATLTSRDKLDQLITLCQQSLPQVDALQVVLGIGDVFAVHGELARAKEFYSLVILNGDESRHKGTVADAYMKRGEVHSRQGRWKESTSDLRHSLRLFRDMREKESAARVENILGANYAEQGRIQQAQKYFGRALEVFEGSRRRDMAATVMMNIGNIHNIAGDPEAALAHYKRAQSHFEAVGEVRRLAELHHNMGMSYLRRNEFQKALPEFDASFNLSAQKEIVGQMGLACLGKAMALYKLQDFPVALTMVNQAIGYCSFCVDRLSLADAYKMKGMIHREMHNDSYAESYLHTSLRLNQELDSFLNMGETFYEIGVLEQRQGKNARALASFERACQLFRKVGAMKEFADARTQVESLKRGLHESR